MLYYKIKRCLLLLLSCCFSLDSQAEKLIVGAQELNYFPHYDFDAQIDKGVGWAILEAFAEVSGHEFIYLSMPIRRLQLELAKGNIDFVYPDNRGWYNKIVPSKEKYFSLPLTYALTGTIVKTGNSGKGIDAVKRLAMPLGFTPVNWQERIDSNVTKITWVKDTKQGLALLYQERVDALDLEYFVAQYSSMNLYPDNTFTIDLTLPHNEIPFSLSTLNQRTIIEELNKFIVSNPDLIKQIQAKYTITPYEQLTKKFLQEQGLTKDSVWHSL